MVGKLIALPVSCDIVYGDGLFVVVSVCVWGVFMCRVVNCSPRGHPPHRGVGGGVRDELNSLLLPM